MLENPKGRCRLPGRTFAGGTIDTEISAWNLFMGEKSAAIWHTVVPCVRSLLVSFVLTNEAPIGLRFKAVVTALKKDFMLVWEHLNGTSLDQVLHSGAQSVSDSLLRPF